MAAEIVDKPHLLGRARQAVFLVMLLPVRPAGRVLLPARRSYLR